jgi:hypothetical protein
VESQRERLFWLQNSENEGQPRNETPHEVNRVDVRAPGQDCQARPIHAGLGTETSASECKENEKESEKEKVANGKHYNV